MARLRFPGRPGNRFDRYGIRYGADEARQTTDPTLAIVASIHKGLQRFRDLFGDSDEDDFEFEGFTPKEVKAAEKKLQYAIENEKLCQEEKTQQQKIRCERTRATLASLTACDDIPRTVSNISKFKKTYQKIVETGIVVKARRRIRQTLAQDIAEVKALFPTENGAPHPKVNTLAAHVKLKPPLQHQPVFRRPVGRPSKKSVNNLATTATDYQNGVGYDNSAAHVSLFPSKPSSKYKHAAKQILARATKQAAISSTRHLMAPTHKVRKFVLPTKSSRSSRVIKPNKRFLEDDSIHELVAKQPKLSPTLPTPAATSNTSIFGMRLYDDKSNTFSAFQTHGLSLSPFNMNREKGFPAFSAAPQPSGTASFTDGIGNHKPLGSLDQPLIIEGKRPRKPSLIMRMKLVEDDPEDEIRLQQQLSDTISPAKTSFLDIQKSPLDQTSSPSLPSLSKIYGGTKSLIAPAKLFTSPLSSSLSKSLKHHKFGVRLAVQNTVVLRQPKLQLNRTALNRSKAALARSLKAQLKREAKLERRRRKSQHAFGVLPTSTHSPGSALSQLSPFSKLVGDSAIEKHKSGLFEGIEAGAGSFSPGSFSSPPATPVQPSKGIKVEIKESYQSSLIKDEVLLMKYTIGGKGKCVICSTICVVKNNRKLPKVPICICCKRTYVFKRRHSNATCKTGGRCNVHYSINDCADCKYRKFKAVIQRAMRLNLIKDKSHDPPFLGTLEPVFKQKRRRRRRCRITGELKPLDAHTSDIKDEKATLPSDEIKMEAATPLKKQRHRSADSDKLQSHKNGEDIFSTSTPVRQRHKHRSGDASFSSTGTPVRSRQKHKSGDKIVEPSSLRRPSKLLTQNKDLINANNLDQPLSVDVGQEADEFNLSPPQSSSSPGKGSRSPSKKVGVSDSDNKMSDDDGDVEPDGGRSRGTSRGPRIKHVCRRAAMVFPHQRATFAEDPLARPTLTLSALPTEEKQQLWAKSKSKQDITADSSAEESGDDKKPLTRLSSFKSPEKKMSSPREEKPTETKKEVKPPNFVVDLNDTKGVRNSPDILTLAHKVRKKSLVRHKSGRGYTRKIRCRECKGCKTPECGVCYFCRDKPKFGGPGKIKKCCIHSVCLAPKIPRKATDAFIEPKSPAKTNRRDDDDNSGDYRPSNQNISINASGPTTRFQDKKSSNPHKIDGGGDGAKDSEEEMKEMSPDETNSMKSKPSPSSSSSKYCGLDMDGSGPSKKTVTSIHNKRTVRYGKGKYSPAVEATIQLALTDIRNPFMNRMAEVYNRKFGIKRRDKMLAPQKQQSQELKLIENQTAYCFDVPLKTHLIKADYKDDFDLETVWFHGFSLTLTGTSCIRTLCYLCGSAGRQELIFCIVCCQPYHNFCLEEDERPDNSECEEGEEASGEDSHHHGTNNTTLTWCCRRCQFCHVCGQQNGLLKCHRCKDTYHPECLGPNYPTRPSRKNIWVCTKCVRCKSCGATTPGVGTNATWTYDFSLCYDCGKLMDKGNFCPVCHKCYSDDDWESKMVQCATCESWVHAKCEELSDEMYHLVSLLPEEVQFTCRVCSTEKPAYWERVLKNEFSSGLSNVLNALMGSKCAQMLLEAAPPRETKKLRLSKSKTLDDSKNCEDYNPANNTADKGPNDACNNSFTRNESEIHNELTLTEKPGNTASVGSDSPVVTPVVTAVSRLNEKIVERCDCDGALIINDLDRGSMNSRAHKCDKSFCSFNNVKGDSASVAECVQNHRNKNIYSDSPVIQPVVASFIGDSYQCTADLCESNVRCVTFDQGQDKSFNSMTNGQKEQNGTQPLNEVGEHLALQKSNCDKNLINKDSSGTFLRANSNLLTVNCDAAISTESASTDANSHASYISHKLLRGSALDLSLADASSISTIPNKDSVSKNLFQDYSISSSYKNLSQSTGANLPNSDNPFHASNHLSDSITNEILNKTSQNGENSMQDKTKENTGDQNPTTFLGGDEVTLTEKTDVIKGLLSNSRETTGKNHPLSPVQNLFYDRQLSIWETLDKNGTYPRDFQSIKLKIDSGSYSSVEEFSEDIVRIIQALLFENEHFTTRRKYTNSVRSIFVKLMERSFPWFNVNTCKLWEHNRGLPEGMLKDAVLPPSTDHTYAQWLERTDAPMCVQPSPFKNICTPQKQSSGEVISVQMSKCVAISNVTLQSEDTRACLLCLTLGDDLPNSAGRLLYCGQDDWIHINCALWSAEVFESSDGSLQNVPEAVSRGKKLRCDHCQQAGATVGCCEANCRANFHFMCARAAACAFQVDQTIFCKLHKDCVEMDLVPEGGFEISRRVCVDLNKIRAKSSWGKAADPATLNVIIGSCTVENLGVLKSFLSDREDCLYPVDFCSTRIYWSTQDTRRRSVYTCRIVEVKPVELPELHIQDMRIIHDESHPEFVPLDRLGLENLGIPNFRKSLRNPSGIDDVIFLESDASCAGAASALFSSTTSTRTTLSVISKSTSSPAEGCADVGDQALFKSWGEGMQSTRVNKPITKPIDLSGLSASTIALLNIKDPLHYMPPVKSTKLDVVKSSLPVIDEELGLVKIAERLNSAASCMQRATKSPLHLSAHHRCARSQIDRSKSLSSSPVHFNHQVRQRSNSEERYLSPLSPLASPNAVVRVNLGSSSPIPPPRQESRARSESPFTIIKCPDRHVRVIRSVSLSPQHVVKVSLDSTVRDSTPPNEISLLEQTERPAPAKDSLFLTAGHALPVTEGSDDDSEGPVFTGVDQESAHQIKDLVSLSLHRPMSSTPEKGLNGPSIEQSFPSNDTEAVSCDGSDTLSVENIRYILENVPSEVLEGDEVKVVVLTDTEDLSEEDLLRLTFSAIEGTDNGMARDEGVLDSNIVKDGWSGDAENLSNGEQDGSSSYHELLNQNFMRNGGTTTRTAGQHDEGITSNDNHHNSAGDSQEVSNENTSKQRPASSGLSPRSSCGRGGTDDGGGDDDERKPCGSGNKKETSEFDLEETGSEKEEESLETSGLVSDTQDNLHGKSTSVGDKDEDVLDETDGKTSVGRQVLPQTSSEEEVDDIAGCDKHPETSDAGQATTAAVNATSPLDFTDIEQPRCESSSLSASGGDDDDRLLSSSSQVQMVESLNENLTMSHEESDDDLKIIDLSDTERSQKYDQAEIKSARGLNQIVEPKDFIPVNEQANDLGTQDPDLVPGTSRNNNNSAGGSVCCNREVGSGGSISPQCKEDIDQKPVDPRSLESPDPNSRNTEPIAKTRSTAKMSNQDTSDEESDYLLLDDFSLSETNDEDETGQVDKELRQKSGNTRSGQGGLVESDSSNVVAHSNTHNGGKKLEQLNITEKAEMVDQKVPECSLKDTKNENSEVLDGQVAKVDHSNNKNPKEIDLSEPLAKQSSETECQGVPSTEPKNRTQSMLLGSPASNFKTLVVRVKQMTDDELRTFLPTKVLSSQTVSGGAKSLDEVESDDERIQCSTSVKEACCFDTGTRNLRKDSCRGGKSEQRSGKHVTTDKEWEGSSEVELKCSESRQVRASTRRREQLKGDDRSHARSVDRSKVKSVKRSGSSKPLKDEDLDKEGFGKEDVAEIGDENRSRKEKKDNGAVQKEMQDDETLDMNKQFHSGDSKPNDGSGCEPLDMNKRFSSGDNKSTDGSGCEQMPTVKPETQKIDDNDVIELDSDEDEKELAKIDHSAGGFSFSPEIRDRAKISTFSGKEFSTNENLHEKIVEKIKAESLARSSPGEEGPFKCPTCKRMYRTRERFESHVRDCDFEVSTSDEDEKPTIKELRSSERFRAAKREKYDHSLVVDRSEKFLSSASAPASPPLNVPLSIIITDEYKDEKLSPSSRDLSDDCSSVQSQDSRRSSLRKSTVTQRNAAPAHLAKVRRRDSKSTLSPDESTCSSLLSPKCYTRHAEEKPSPKETMLEAVGLVSRRSLELSPHSDIDPVGQMKLQPRISPPVMDEAPKREKRSPAQASGNLRPSIMAGGLPKQGSSKQKSIAITYNPVVLEEVLMTSTKPKRPRLKRIWWVETSEPPGEDNEDDIGEDKDDDEESGDEEGGVARRTRQRVSSEHRSTDRRRSPKSSFSSHHPDELYPQEETEHSKNAKGVLKEFSPQIKVMPHENELTPQKIDEDLHKLQAGGLGEDKEAESSPQLDIQPATAVRKTRSRTKLASPQSASESSKAGEKSPKSSEPSKLRRSRGRPAPNETIKSVPISDDIKQDLDNGSILESSTVKEADTVSENKPQEIIEPIEFDIKSDDKNHKTKEECEEDTPPVEDSPAVEDTPPVEPGEGVSNKHEVTDHGDEDVQEGLCLDDSLMSRLRRSQRPSSKTAKLSEYLAELKSSQNPLETSPVPEKRARGRGRPMIYPDKERPNASEVKRGRGRPPLLNKQLSSQQKPDRSPLLRRPGRLQPTVSHPPSGTDFGGGNIEAEIQESSSSCPRNENENHLEEPPVESTSDDRPITNEMDNNSNQGRHTSGSSENSCSTHQEVQSAGESSMENSSGPSVDISKPNELNGGKIYLQTQDYIDLTNEGDEDSETFHPSQSKLSGGERKSESQSESSLTNTMPANSENNGEGSGATSSAGTGGGDITVKDDDAGDAPPQLRTLNDALKTTGQKLRIIIRSPNVVAAQKIGELIRKTAMGVNSKQSEIIVTTTDSSKAELKSVEYHRSERAEKQEQDETDGIKPKTPQPKASTQEAASDRQESADDGTPFVSRSVSPDSISAAYDIQSDDFSSETSNDVDDYPPSSLDPDSSEYNSNINNIPVPNTKQTIEDDYDDDDDVVIVKAVGLQPPEQTMAIKPPAVTSASNQPFPMMVGSSSPSFPRPISTLLKYIPSTTVSSLRGFLTSSVQSSNMRTNQFSQQISMSPTGQSVSPFVSIQQNQVSPSRNPAQVMLSEVSPGHYIIQQNPNQRTELLQAQELAHSGLLIQSASNQSGMILQNTNQPGLLFQNSSQPGLSLQGGNQSNVLFGHNNPSGLVLQQSNAPLLQGTGQGGLSFISLNPSNPLAQTIISPLQPLQSHVSPPSILQPSLGLAPLMQAATLASSQPMLLSQSFLAQTGMFLPQLATQSMVSRQSGMDIGVGQVQQKTPARGSSVVIDPHAHMLSATLNSSILKANQLGISTQNQVQMLSGSRFSAPSTNQMTLPSSTNIHAPQMHCSSTVPAVSHTYTLHSQGTGLSSSNVSYTKSTALPVAPKLISPSTVLAKVDGAPTQVNYMGSFDLNSSSLKTTIHGQPLNKHASEKIMDLVQRALNNKGQEQIPGVEVKSAFTDTPQGPKKVLKVFINEDILPGQSPTRSGPFGQSLPTQTAAPSTSSSVVASLLSTMQLSSASQAGPESSWTKILPSSSQVPVCQQQCQTQTQSQEGASLWSGTNTGYISVPISQNLSGSRQHGSIKPHSSAPFRRALKPAIYSTSLKRTFSQLSAQSTHDEPVAKRPIFGKTLNNDGIVTGSFQQIVGRNLLVETPTSSSETSNVLNNAQESSEMSQFKPSQCSTDGSTGQLPTVQPTEGQHQPHHIAQQQIHLQQSPHKRASFPLMSPVKRPTAATHPVNAIKERARKQILKKSLMKKEAFSPSSGQGFKPPEVVQRKKSVVSRRLKTVSHHPLIHHKKGNVTLPQPTLEEEVVATPLDLGKDHPHGPGGKAAKEKNVSRLKFEISSDDGFSCQGDTVEDAWNQVLEKVQDVRAASRMKQLSYAGISGRNMFGVDHDAVVYLIEQLYGAVHCHRNYKFKFHKYDLDQADAEVTLNPSGAARSETFGSRKPFDMFNFLKSMYRTKPGDDEREKEEEMALKSSRRATSLSLPMAMRFRKLKTFAKEAVDVYRSKIHGRGLFCKRNIDAGEMVIEYAGEVIRASLTDKREKYYESRGIGCYMFRIDDDEVVDATMHGSAARFINHSCEPNCFSKVILVDGKKHIVIFAMRPIKRGEELTYDYKFPIEEVKIPCSCGSKRCRKYLN